MTIKPKKLRQLQDDIYAQLQTDRQFGPGFRLFAGERRSVGELMWIVELDRRAVSDSHLF
jgi:hypothetical protein